MTEPFKPAIHSDHAAHDATWMAALAARDPDLDPSELARAQAALESCGPCADLFADLVAVAAAIPTAAIPPRPRDFTLTPADAARLRSRGLRRWFAAIGSARDGITFPLAMGLTTLGIAGLLLATIPGALMSGMGGAASGPQVLSTVGNVVVQAAPSAAAPAPAAEASAAPAASEAPSGAAAAAPSAPATENADAYAMSAAPSGDAAGEGVFSGSDDTRDRQAAEEMSTESAGFSTLGIVAGSLLIVGLVLFALRRTARHL